MEKQDEGGLEAVGVLGLWVELIAGVGEVAQEKCLLPRRAERVYLAVCSFPGAAVTKQHRL